jgi:hypothetical protein
MVREVSRTDPRDVSLSPDLSLSDLSLSPDLSLSDLSLSRELSLSPDLSLLSAVLSPGLLLKAVPCWTRHRYRIKLDHAPK